MTVSLAEEEAKAVAAERPDGYEEIWRHRTIFMGLRVDLSKIPARRVRELIAKSWRHSAPKRVVAAYDKLAGLPKAHTGSALRYLARQPSGAWSTPSRNRQASARPACAAQTLRQRFDACWLGHMGT
jgi:hypothetical protein